MYRPFSRNKIDRFEGKNSIENGISSNPSLLIRRNRWIPEPRPPGQTHERTDAGRTNFGKLCFSQPPSTNGSHQRKGGERSRLLPRSQRDNSCCYLALTRATFVVGWPYGATGDSAGQHEFELVTLMVTLMVTSSSFTSTNFMFHFDRNRFSDS